MKKKEITYKKLFYIDIAESELPNLLNKIIKTTDDVVAVDRQSDGTYWACTEIMPEETGEWEEC